MIKSILIVGGGSAGWITAAALTHSFKGKVTVSLIEASDIPGISVGESTNPTTQLFNKRVGIDEMEFMRATDATYKLSIRFMDFFKKEKSFHHPFSTAYCKRKSDFWYCDKIDHQFLSFHLSNAHKFYDDDIRDEYGELEYGYQIDTGKYGDYLRKVSKERGTHHIVDRVEEIVLDESGKISHLKTQNSGSLRADLFIDCTGFRSMILGDTLKEPFQPIDHLLLNDRAIALRIPYQDKQAELDSATQCHALSAGWVWNIPLWSRKGNGYVYSSDFISENDAEKELRQYLGEERVEGLDAVHLKMKTGRHSRSWVQNCVAIGLSSGFIEPLESTGLALTQLGVLDLVEQLKGGNYEESRDAFNATINSRFDITVEFIMAHYLLTEREDSEYWKYIKHNNPSTDRFDSIIEHARRGVQSPVFDDDSMIDHYYSFPAWLCILSGMSTFNRQPKEIFSPDITKVKSHFEVLSQSIYYDN